MAVKYEGISFMEQAAGLLTGKFFQKTSIYHQTIMPRQLARDAIWKSEMTY